MATLTEADVLFEMFLPLLCSEHAAAMQRFEGEVLFEMSGDEPRWWTLSGGKYPWVKRGRGDTPDAHIIIAESLVREVVRGFDVDVEAAVRDGRIVTRGSVSVLQRLGFTWHDAKRVLSGMLGR